MRRLSRRCVSGVLAVPLLLGASGCSDSSSPTGPTPGAGGATQVRGSERLSWSQAGYGSWLKFRAYVDDKPIDLPSATCTAAEPAECSAPLPPLSDGVHTIALVNVFVSTGVESERTASMSVQKVSNRVSVSSFPPAFARSGGLRLQPVITLADDLSFTADIVATGVHTPAQMTSLPDGRLLVAEADGSIRVVRPGEPEIRVAALEAQILSSQQLGPMGIASHPDFAQNRFVYVSLLERDRSESARLRLLRLREVGDTVGEAATLLEAPVAGEVTQSPPGPRMAFGPDRLLYVMLPPGLEFVNEPAASTPRAAMLRVTDEGRIAEREPLAGVTSSPLGFTWHPATGALWVMLRGEDGAAAVKSFGGRDRAQASSAQAPRLLAREGLGAAAGTLLLRAAPDNLLMAKALAGILAARVALPVRSDGGLSDRIGDLVAGSSGTLFAVTSNGPPGGVTATDVVVRLTPVPAASPR